MSVDEIKSGMRGYGKTVFRGETVERFEAEIIGVMKNTAPKGDMILARLSGGPLKESGLIAGMSGSPVYINDKLIGAVAYGWSFAKEPIAGITPIQEMVQVAQASGESREGADANLGPPGPVGYSALSETPRLTSGIRSLPVPVMVSGASSATLQLLQPNLERFNLFPVASGAPAASEVGKAPFEAGAPLGVQLVRGDVDMVAVGTLTYRDGEKVLGFGHPMLQCGPTDMPMVAAYVHAVLSSQHRSFKLAGSAQVVGRITEDRRAAISGEIGRFARMIPCAVTVVNSAAGRQHTYSYEMIRQRLLTPALLQSVVADSLGATEGVTGDYMLHLKTEIRLDGRSSPLLAENFYYESGGFSLGLMQVASKVSALMNNPFEPARIAAFDIKATVHPGRRTAALDGLTTQKRRVRPGDRLHFLVRLQPFGSDTSVHLPFEVSLPLSTPAGATLTVTASDANARLMMDRVANPGAFRPETFDQLWALLSREYDNREVALRVTFPNMGVSVHGETLPNLPASLINILAFGNQSSASPAAHEIVQTRKTDWVVTGSQSLSLVVEQEP